MRSAAPAARRWPARPWTSSARRAWSCSSASAPWSRCPSCCADVDLLFRRQAAEQMLRGAEILMPAAAGLEERDLVVALAARLLAAGELEGIGDIGVADHAALQRLGDVA